MRKLQLLLVVATAALAAVPAVSFAQSPPSAKDRATAVRLCRAQLTAMGPAAFKQFYGANTSKANAWGKCVSKFARLQQSNRTNAAKQCRAEQNDPSFAATHDGKTFAQFYGTNADDSNAFGNCVSLKASAASAGQHQEVMNAAQRCRAQRTSMGDKSFSELYGANANDRNAFGKCVSKLAREEHANRVNAAEACRAEQNDLSFPATHGGKTFTQFYGTNANGSNAFGKCVSRKAKQASQERQEATLTAARQCKAERAQMGERAFRAKYGVGLRRANAFGNCVSQKASRQ
jgi:hypothetical protein